MNLERNIGVLGNELQEYIKKLHICVIGVGGVGGYIIESLVRLGVEKLTIIDYDYYDETNINRQIGCSLDTIGCSKVEVIKKRILSINPNCIVKAIHNKLDITLDQIYDKENISFFFNTIDGVYEKCLISKEILEKLKKPLIFASCGPLNSRNALFLPESNYNPFDLYYSNEDCIIKNTSIPLPCLITAVIQSSNIAIQLFINFLLGNNKKDNVILFFLKDFKFVDVSFEYYKKYYLK